MGFFRAMEAAAGAEHVGDRSLGHRSFLFQSQVVDWDKPQQVRAAEGWPRDQDWCGSGQGDSLDCKTPLFSCIPLCGRNPRA